MILLTLDDFWEKYIAITGAASKNWTKLNKRMRTQLNLRSVCTVEQYVGRHNKTRKRHKWRWERKSSQFPGTMIPTIRSLLSPLPQAFYRSICAPYCLRDIVTALMAPVPPLHFIVNLS